jgi:aspartate aminotransferase-like enzyme
VRDLQKIGEIARKRDILFIVDAVSVLGGDYLPVDEWSVDVCVTGSQKCLACPPGLAMVSVSEKAWESIEKNARPYYFDLVQFREFSEKKEIPQTPALSLFYALDEALKMLREEGLENRIKRHAKCAKAFHAALKTLKLTPFPNGKFLSNTVIAVNVPAGVDNSKVIEIMREKYGVVIAGGMGELKKSILRIGCMGIISEAETILTVNALENALTEVNYSMKMGAGVEAAREIFRP